MEKQANARVQTYRLFDVLSDDEDFNKKLKPMDRLCLAMARRLEQDSERPVPTQQPVAEQQPTVQEQNVAVQ